ncbi:MAG: histidine phosphatase family protein [Acidobacteria bacterium]|nr:histidine phosphatase family protein [Acidobacteriota bacterium]
MQRVVTILALVLAFGVASCSRPQQGSTVVLIVRHAEKASDAEDSPLSDAGTQRAQALAGVAADAGVSAIYTTQFRRNRDTAQPLAARTGVAVTEMPVDLQNPGDYGQRLARDIIEKHRGQTVAVVAHGNTVVSIVEGLMGQSVALGDVQYGDLLIVTVPPTGAAGLVKAQYGAGAAGGSMMKK